MCVLSRDQDPAWWRKRGERRRRNGIRSLDPDVMTPARTLGAGIALTHNTPGRKHVMRVFWCLSFGSVPHHTEVSLSLDHEVNRPGLWPYFPGIIIIIIIRYYPESRIRSLYTVDNVLLTLRADTLMQCNDKYLYFRQIFNVITRLFSGCVSISVCHH